MNLLFSDAFTYFYSQRALQAGISKEDLCHAVNFDINPLKPPLYVKNHDDQQIMRLFKVLHDIGYQKKNELTDFLSVMDKSGLHKAYMLNSSCISEVIEKMIYISKLNSTGIRYELSVHSGQACLFINFTDQRADFYSPHACLATASQIICEFFNDNSEALDISASFKDSHPL